MFTTSRGGRLFGLAAAGLALAALQCGVGVAAARPSQPADIPFLPTPPDPGSALPAPVDPASVLPAPVDPASALPTAADPGSVLPTSQPLSGLPSTGSLIPLVSDAGKLLAAANDPNAWVANTQNLLNDAGSLLGLPGAMPNISSFAPPGGVPNVPASSVPVTPLAPAASPAPLV